MWRQKSRERNWEKLFDLTVPLDSVLTRETSRGECETVPFKKSEMSIPLRQCPTVILFLLEEWESCTQNCLLLRHCIDPWNLISRTYLQVALMGCLVETECLVVLKMLGNLKNGNICLSGCLIVLKLARRILEFIIRRIKPFPFWAVYCALCIAI